MASTYVNDLRLNEMATGDASGSWGTVTNTNLELIAEAFSFGTEAITTNADTHTTTIADGATDPGRSMFLKYTGTLDSACTITIAPNTVSKLWFIENGTSGSQNIIISQGSGANITIPAGQTKAIYSDGAGSGAAMVDAFATLNVVDLLVDDDLTVTDDATIGGTLGVTGVVTANAGVVVDEMTLDADTLTATDTFTIDAVDDITLNSDNSGRILFGDASVIYGIAKNSSSDFVLEVGTSDKDMLFKGQDGGASITALTLDMSNAGRATFNDDVLIPRYLEHVGDSDTYLGFGGANDFEIVVGASASVNINATDTIFNEASADRNFRVESNSLTHAFYVDGGSNSGVGHITMGNYGAADSGYFLSVSDAANKVALIAAETTGTAVEIRSTASGSSSSGPDLYLNRLATGADDNQTSAILFGAANNAGEAEIFSRITTQIKSASNGAESGAIFIKTMKSGTENNRLQIRDDASVFNEDSVDVDFRVESDGNASMLMVDAAANKVGIGVFAPDATLEVRAANANIRASGGSNTNNKVEIGYNDSTGPYIKAGSSGITTLQFYVDNTSLAMTLDASDNLLVGKASASDTSAGFQITGGNVVTVGSGSGFTYQVNDGSAFKWRVNANGGIYNFSSNNVNLSDQREKKNIEALGAQWDAVKAWSVKEFHYNEDENSDAKKVGVIAQDVETNHPNLVTDFELSEDKTRKAVKEQQLMWLAIKALQEAQARIETLETKVATLEG